MITFSNRIPARRTLFLATILAAGVCGLHAQDAPPAGPPAESQMRQRGPNPEREIAQLTEALSLTPDQQTQVKALLKARREKVEALRSAAERPTREQMQAVRKDTDAKINAILNEDQKTKYAAWEEQHRRGPGGPGGPGGDAPAPPPIE